MHNPFLIGKRLYLRALEEADLAGGYVSWLNDAEVCQHNAHHVFPYDAEQARAYIESSRMASDRLVLAMVLRDEERHIGNISLQGINVISRNAEFAVLLGEKDCWGQGLAKEAAFLLVRHGFFELNLHRIHCGTSALNQPMQRLAEFLGMTREGIRREAHFKAGAFVDLLEYGLLRDEFLLRMPELGRKLGLAISR